MNNPLISIIIPCYNCSAVIGETLGSITGQSISDFEIIVVDDGSTDASGEKIGEYNDPRIKHLRQNNQGVSAARNKGFTQSRGIYTVFFDADDIMSENFLKTRLAALEANPQLQFVCGEVKKITGTAVMNDYFRGTSGNALAEILLYDKLVTTCPSNYMFRKNFLSNNKLAFNERLSSTADKLFLVQCARAGRSDFIPGEGKLLYRVSEHSMSHHFTEKLVKDNEEYYHQLISLNLIPPSLRRQSLLTGYTILSGSYKKLGKWQKALLYAAKAFLMHPAGFVRRLRQ